MTTTARINGIKTETIPEKCAAPDVVGSLVVAAGVVVVVAGSVPIVVVVVSVVGATADPWILSVYEPDVSSGLVTTMQ